MSRRIALLVAAALMATQADAQMGITLDQYIEQYKDLAIGEMDRSGIPASITLAQGILESSYGNSSLAREANNHFGIKCHSDWTGASYYIKDDDRNKHGKLIESCFRSYPSSYESFFDHTDFLTRKGRYSFLFDYPNTDYISWAKGLKKAGYATNPKYADLLINVVEKNDLNQYDFMTNEVLAYNTAAQPVKAKEPVYVAKPVTTKTQGTVVTKVESSTAEELGAMASAFPAPYKPGVFYINHIKTVSAKVGDTSRKIAKKHNVSHKRLLQYNDLEVGDELIPNQYVFLQPKRKKSRERRTYHKAKKGETIYIISQLYGLQLEDLTTRNLMRAGEEPKAGSRIYLNKEPRVKPVVYVPSEQPALKPRLTPAPTKPAVSQPIVKTTAKRPATITTKPQPTTTPKPIATTQKPRATTGKTYRPVTTRTADPAAIKDIENEIVKPRPGHTGQGIRTNTVAHAPRQVPPPVVPMRKNTSTNRQAGTQNPASSTGTPNPAIISPSASSVEIAAVAIATPSGQGPSAPVIKTVKEYQPTISKPKKAPVKTTESSPTPFGERTTSSKATLATVAKDNRKHVVQKGDTLYSLARHYEVPIHELRFKNDIDANNIQLGQELVID